jgi:hypothetical protein
LGEPVTKSPGCKFSLIEGQDAGDLACRTCRRVHVMFYNATWEKDHYDTPLRELKD